MTPPRRHRLATIVLPAALCLGVLPFTRADAPAPASLYAQDFEKLDEGPPPGDILVMNGAAIVKKSDGNGYLELAGDPLDSNGVLVGPADQATYTVAARARARASGKRMPEFGLGACGPGVYRLWLMPAVGELQLIKADDVKAAKAFAWRSDQWTCLKLQVRKTGEGKFVVEGKAWPDGQPEPTEWTLSFDETEAPQPGRAGLYATPYAGTPTDFDDVSVTPSAP